jgi:hypothetical protein
VRSITEECLNRMIFDRRASLRHAASAYLAHYQGAAETPGSRESVVGTHGADRRPERLGQRARAAWWDAQLLLSPRQLRIAGGIATATMLFAVHGAVAQIYVFGGMSHAPIHDRLAGRKRRKFMSIILRKFRWFAAMALACTVGILPSCVSMGGGMKYVVSDPSFISEQIVSM